MRLSLEKDECRIERIGTIWLSLPDSRAKGNKEILVNTLHATRRSTDLCSTVSETDFPLPIPVHAERTAPSGVLAT
jgi:hypothetical protein